MWFCFVLSSQSLCVVRIITSRNMHNNDNDDNNYSHAADILEITEDERFVRIKPTLHKRKREASYSHRMINLRILF